MSNIYCGETKWILFLSVDIKGSTSFKQHDDNFGYVDRWFGFFYTFYSEFQTEFSTQCFNEFKNGIADDKTPILWKPIGDELVFTILITKAVEIQLAVNAFCKTLQNRSQYLRSSHKSFQLDVKGTCWLAEFPCTNAEFFFPYNNQTDKNNIKDYAGPSIDIGFRISKFATPEKLIISAEIARTLAEYSEPHIYFDGLEDLKGVLKGHGYPIFWILCQKEQEFSTLRKKCDGTSVKKYCDSFFNRIKRVLPPPFFLDGELLREIPNGFTEKNKETVAKLLQYQQLESIQADEEDGKAPLTATSLSKLEQDLERAITHT